MTLRSVSAVLAISILPVLFRVITAQLPKLRGLLITYLTLQLLDAALLFGFSSNTRVMFWWYVLSSPVRWVLYVLLVKSLYGAIFQDYPGIQTVGRWSMYGALLVAGLLSLSVATATYSTHNPHVGHFYVFILAQRTILSALVLFVALLFLAVSRYPIRIPKAISVSSVAFCFLFSFEVVALFYAWQYPGRNTYQLNYAVSLLSAFCYLAWAILLTRSPVYSTSALSRPHNGDKEERLLSQLNAINMTLLRAVKK